ncbi:hypothetical protein CYMTET_56339 [Cymbomonas tetramitiformis]|uniref:Uncharacterized protein n=1 Tax=Cymbomonas tetramitiformis TaxID=36881 RepID=A0AAE0BBG5_9CHLO|nr:hypothetical protein CYMTET_56339 [Cymbomonas tetramitiformis]
MLKNNMSFQTQSTVTPAVHNSRTTAEAFVLARRDDAPRLDGLFQRGFSPETVDPMGNTLLHAAVGAGALQTAKTVVHWAVKAYQPPNVAFLSLTNSLKQTPLAIAQEKGHVHVIEWLMTLGDPDDESTPQLRGPDPHHGSDPAYHFATSEGSLASAQASKGMPTPLLPGPSQFAVTHAPDTTPAQPKRTFPAATPIGITEAPGILPWTPRSPGTLSAQSATSIPYPAQTPTWPQAFDPYRQPAPTPTPYPAQTPTWPQAVEPSNRPAPMPTPYTSQTPTWPQAVEPSNRPAPMPTPYTSQTPTWPQAVEPDNRPASTPVRNDPYNAAFEQPSGSRALLRHWRYTTGQRPLALQAPSVDRVGAHAQVQTLAQIPSAADSYSTFSNVSRSSTCSFQGSVEKALEPSQTTAIVPGLALPDHMLVVADGPDESPPILDDLVDQLSEILIIHSQLPLDVRPTAQLLVRQVARLVADYKESQEALEIASARINASHLKASVEESDACQELAEARSEVADLTSRCDELDRALQRAEASKLQIEQHDARRLQSQQDKASSARETAERQLRDLTKQVQQFHKEKVEWRARISQHSRRGAMLQMRMLLHQQSACVAVPGVDSPLVCAVPSERPLIPNSVVAQLEEEKRGLEQRCADVEAALQGRTTRCSTLEEQLLAARQEARGLQKENAAPHGRRTTAAGRVNSTIPEKDGKAVQMHVGESPNSPRQQLDTSRAAGDSPLRLKVQGRKSEGIPSSVMSPPSSSVTRDMGGSPVMSPLKRRQPNQAQEPISVKKRSPASNRENRHSSSSVSEGGTESAGDDNEDAQSSSSSESEGGLFQLSAFGTAGGSATLHRQKARIQRIRM